MSFDQMLGSRHALLMGPLFDAAKADLLAPLQKAGASSKKAFHACREIAWSVRWLHMMNDESNKDMRKSWDEIGRLRESLMSLEDQLQSLSDHAEARLFSIFHQPDRVLDELEPFLTENDIAAGNLDSPTWGIGWESPLDRFRRALPQIIKRIPELPNRQGGRDDALHFVVQDACIEWAVATGRLPPATINAYAERREAESPLYKFLQSNCGAPISADLWVRTLRKLRR
jgi:hypothetical protein